MLKSFKKMHIITISLILAVICGAFYCLTYYQKPAQAQTAQRNIEISRNAIDCQSIFNEFEDAKLDAEGSLTTFEGVKTFNLTDFEELDLVADTDVEEVQLQVKYNYSYNSETNLVTLTATLIGDEGDPLIDTMYGVAFVDEDGNLDAVFDCDDGEYILLSEMQEAGMIENCGWFKKAWKKTKTAVNKGCSNAVGVIGAVATVAVPIIVGIAAAATLPLAATIAIGAVVGAEIAATTAIASTLIEDGKVDWGTVGICGGLGVAVGALVSGVAYEITSLIKSMTQVSNAIKNVDANRQAHILQDKHGWTTIGDNTWDTASEAIEHTLKKGSASAYKAGNEIVTATYKGQTVQVVVRETDKVLQIVDAWIKLL